MRPTRAPALLAGASLLLAPALSGADTLREALAKAYKTSPTLTAAQAGLRAVDENVPIARAAGLPSVSATGGYVQNPFGTDNSLSNPDRQATGGVAVTVPVFTFGAVRNSVRAAETRVEAGRATLRGTESDLFTAVVGAFLDVIRDESIVSLNQQNVHVLDVNLQATKDRFQVGDLTRTDVAQSQARLSLARAQLQSVQSTLIASRENYVRLVGTPPGTLDQPPALPTLPGTPDEAVRIALENNPVLIASQRTRDATGYDIAVARASRLPRLNLSVGGNYYNYLGALGAGTNVRVGQTGTSANLGASVSVPLFQGGRPAAQIRQAEARKSQAIEQVTDTERSVVANTRAAYAAWRASQEVIASSQNAVDANKLSLEGVRAENSVGTRTILDILNAEQELLNSQTTLVSARRNAYVAGFALLAAMGRAQASDLGLNGGPLYDPVVNYERVRHRISDFSADPEPVAQATGTSTTPAQTADVTRPLDPELDTPVDRTPVLTTGDKAPSR